MLSIVYMIRYFLFIAGWLFSIQLMAQTGIGTTTPDASAKLDVSSTNKGFLPPRIALTALNSASPVTSPATGLLIFNTVSAGTNPNQVTPGYYYWDGVNSKWVRLEDKADNLGNHTATDNIRLNGNYLSNDGGSEGIRVDNAGNVGIGTNTPAVPLDVNGAANANTLNLYNSTIGVPSLVLRNGDAASSYSDISQIKMGWSGSAVGKSQYAQFIHSRHNSGAGGNAIDFYLSNGTADNTVTTGSTKAMTIESPGNLTIAGKISHSDPSGTVVTKAAGFVDAGNWVTLGNLKARLAPTGNRGLQVATVEGTYTVIGSDLLSANGAAGTTIFENNKLIITTTPTYLNAGLHFVWGGYTDTWLIMDTGSRIAWRITFILGTNYGAFDNFVSIERLL
jgi:hypothetical protein